MILEEDFNVLITKRNIEFYTKLGFNVNLKDKITVKSSQLTPYNKNVVKVKCDYCQETINRRFQDHHKIINKTTYNGKDACKDCASIKSKDITELFYNGVHPSQSNSALKKRKATNLERYGVEMPFNSKVILEKAKSSTIENYGVDNIFKYEGFYDIRVASMIEKYGYANVISDPKRREDIISKRNKTLYENKTAPCSTQQSYINDILGGELNYPIGSLMLDIAFLEDNIYLEYQGSGHNLDVKLNKITSADFKEKEMKRYYYLKSKKWNMIEIISNKDSLPKKEKLIEMLNFSKEILKTTSFVQFNIDNGTVKYSKQYYKYDFGELITSSILHKSINRNTYDRLIN